MILTNGHYEIKPIRVTLFFQKETRREKKANNIKASKRRKRIARLKQQALASGYPFIICAACSVPFIGGLTVAEAEAQYAREFPGESIDGRDVICDECFQMFEARRIGIALEGRGQKP